MRRAAVAQLSSNLWTAAIGLVFVPVYIRFLGIESYGLLGLYAALQGLACVLDLGLTTTINRELARLSTRADGASASRDLVRSLEVVYWGIGAIIGIVVALLVPLIARRWVSTAILTPRDVETTLWLVAVLMTCQWPFSFYAGGLTGLNRQVALSRLSAVVAAVRAVGAVLVLAFVAPTIQAFMAWQVFVGLASTGWVATLLWKSLPPSDRSARFSWSEVRTCFRFAAGVTFVGATGAVLLQSDKVVLTRMLRLDEFGYYALAGAVGMSLTLLVTPLFTTVFPAMTRAHARGDEPQLQRLYHQTAEAASVLVFPVAAALVIFPNEVVFVWTGSRSIAEHTAPLVSLLAAGYAMQAIAHVPWALQLSHGWLRLSAGINTVALVAIGPLLVVLTSRYGAVGGALSWLMFHASALGVGQVLVHRRLLRGHLGRWCARDVCRPLLAVLVPCIVARLIVDPAWTRPILAVSLGLVVGGSGLFAASSVATIRGAVTAEVANAWHRLAHSPAH
jgi:O-antigen/teichoic acid export membrane protein